MKTSGCQTEGCPDVILQACASSPVPQIIFQ